MKKVFIVNKKKLISKLKKTFCPFINKNKYNILKPYNIDDREFC